MSAENKKASVGSRGQGAKGLPDSTANPHYALKASMNEQEQQEVLKKEK